MKTKKLRIIATGLLVFFLFSNSAFAAQGVGTITGNQVNLRSGPGLGYSRLTYLYQGQEVTVLGQEGEWYHVSYQGKKGYVYGQYLSLSGNGSNTSDSGMLRYGSKGHAVKTLQGNLIYLGYLKDTADGIFGRLTQEAVLRYQTKNGLTVDGIVGPATQSLIAQETLRLNAILSTAEKYLGTPYVYGGSTPDTGFDCSGFVQYVFRQAMGKTLPRVSREQAASGIAVPYSQLRTGDIVAFHSPVSHVGIYIGNGKFIHSPHTGDVIKITDLKYMNLTAIRRVTGNLAY